MSHHSTLWRGKRVVSAASAACTTGHQALHTAPSAASGPEARLRHAALYRSQPFTHSLALFCHALKASPGFWGRDPNTGTKYSIEVCTSHVNNVKQEFVQHQIYLFQLF
ncbi:hypothetical protein MHYP_G00021700 [Metynnis hypsauchen]